MNPDIITDKEKYQRGWTGGGSETPCGYGSRLDQTAIQREWIPGIFDKYSVRTVADIGAGDLNWVEAMSLADFYEYAAYDLVPRNWRVKEFNVLTDKAPKVDCLMCIWVLNHFPHTEARIALDNLLNSGSKYLLITWENRLPDFLDLKSIESVVIRKRNDERGHVELRLIKL